MFFHLYKLMSYDRVCSISIAQKSHIKMSTTFWLLSLIVMVVITTQSIAEQNNENIDFVSENGVLDVNLDGDEQSVWIDHNHHHKHKHNHHKHKGHHHHHHKHANAPAPSPYEEQNSDNIDFISENGILDGNSDGDEQSIWLNHNHRRRHKHKRNHKHRRHHHKHANAPSPTPSPDVERELDSTRFYMF